MTILLLAAALADLPPSTEVRGTVVEAAEMSGASLAFDLRSPRPPSDGAKTYRLVTTTILDARLLRIRLGREAIVRGRAGERAGQNYLLVEAIDDPKDGGR
jgi:hypothetical protein